MIRHGQNGVGVSAGLLVNIAPQTIANATPTVATFNLLGTDFVEMGRQDAGGGLFNALLIQTAGLYLLAANMGVTATADEFCSLTFRRNGVDQTRINDRATAALESAGVSGSSLIQLAAGDVIDLLVESSDTGAAARDWVGAFGAALLQTTEI